MKRLLVGAALFFGLFMLYACGGGGGGGQGTTISGVASKGIIRNGTIKVYSVNADGSKGALLRETATDTNGVYAADLGGYQGAVLVEASGSYVDEATGTVKTVAADAPLRAAIAMASGNVAAAVTPLTELAVQRIAGQNNTIDVAAIDASNALISQTFKINILATVPADALAANSGDTQAQKEYALFLAAVSKLMQNRGVGLQEVITELKDATSSGSGLAATTAVALQTALTEFAQSVNNKTGINDISGTTLVNIGGTRKTIVLASAGTNALLSGIEATISLPPGVTIKAGAGGQVLDSVLMASGGASQGALASGKYTPSTAMTRGTIKLGVISATGFAAGEFATLQCDIAADATPNLTDFLVTGVKVLDSATARIDQAVLNLNWL